MHAIEKKRGVREGRRDGGRRGGADGGGGTGGSGWEGGGKGKREGGREGGSCRVRERGDTSRRRYVALGSYQLGKVQGISLSGAENKDRLVFILVVQRSLHFRPEWPMQLHQYSAV